MGTSKSTRRIPQRRGRLAFAVASVSWACLLCACSGSGTGTTNLLDLNNSNPFTGSTDQSASSETLSQEEALLAQAYTQDARNPENVLGYARVLKQKGDKQKALSVLANGLQLSPDEPRIASAYGRLALSLGHVKLADRVLNIAMKTAPSPDWRVLSALGTIAAKRKKYPQAQSHFARGLQIAPNQPTVLNNLALVYALDGKLNEAETLLRQAVAAGGGNARLQRNLGLIVNMRRKGKDAASGTDVVDSAPQVAPVAPMPEPVAVTSATEPIKLNPPVTQIDRSSRKGRRLPTQQVQSVTPVIIEAESDTKSGNTPKSSKQDRHYVPPTRIFENPVLGAKDEKDPLKPVPASVPPNLIRRGTYDDSLSGWNFEIEGEVL